MVDPCLCAEAPRATEQCSTQEMALWSHCYSCLRLSTCFKECGHQSLEWRPQGLKGEESRVSRAAAITAKRKRAAIILDQLFPTIFPTSLFSTASKSNSNYSLMCHHKDKSQSRRNIFQEQPWELLIHKPWHWAHRNIDRALANPRKHERVACRD